MNHTVGDNLSSGYYYFGTAYTGYTEYTKYNGIEIGIDG
jgi:hypothetical protein